MEVSRAHASMSDHESAVGPKPELMRPPESSYFLIKRGFGNAQFFRRLPGLLANFEDMIALRCAVRSGHNPGHPQAGGFAQRLGQSCK